jgi:hypothetical protein
MADKKYNIPVGDNAIEIPAWASESTLEALSNQSANAVKLTGKLMNTVTKNKDLDDEIIEAVKTNTQIGINNADVNQKESKARTSLLVKGAEAVRDTAGFFGDSEKPLTSLVKVTETVVNKLKGTDGKLTAAASELDGPFKHFMKTTGKQMANVAVDIGLAWAGWNAAKFEQFAEVQKSMIDSGAVVFDTADAFNELYTDAFQSGLTYKTFSETVANFGGTMVGLGGDVSKGSQTMMKLFKRVELNVDELGDLGLTNKELLNTYAGYIEVQRLTGSLDRQLANGGEELESSFQNLVMEAGAVANLTALSRSEAMNKMLSALSDVNLAAGLTTLEDRGLEDTAGVVEDLTKQLSLFQGIGPSNLVDNIQLALARATSQFSGDMSNFNITQVLAGIDENAIALIEAIAPNMLDDINKAVREAEATNGEISATMIFDILKSADLDKLAASAATGTLLGGAQDFQDTIILIMKNMAGLDGVELEEESERLKALYAESGTATVAMNNMSKAFLTAQEFITLDMQTLASKLELTTEMLASGAGFFADLFKDYKQENPETTNVTTNQEEVAPENLTINSETTVEEYDDSQNAIANDNLSRSVDLLGYDNENNTENQVVSPDSGGATEVATSNTGLNDVVLAQIAELTLPELKDRLTEVMKERTISNKMAAGRPDLISAMMRNTQLELDAINKQIKVHEDKALIENRNDLNHSYNDAVGQHQ